MSESIHSIHIVGSRQFGGAEHFFLRLMHLLREAGHPVTGITRRGTPVAAAVAADCIDQIHVPMINGWDLWSCWRLRRMFSGQSPCIVQTYMGRATRLTRLAPRQPAVHVARLGGYYRIDGYYRHAHAWVGNTRALCDYLVREGLPAKRVFYIGNCVPEPAPATPTEVAAVRERHGLGTAWVLFSLGRLVDHKGYTDLLRALALLPPEIGGQPWVMLIAGDGPEAPALRALATELGLEGRVRWLGWQDRPDRFFAVADVFVCPSREEPLGNVILEAWSHGLPVLSTATAGATELIEPDATGLLCPIEDPSAMARHLSALLSASEGERASLGAAGRRFLEAQFSRDAIRDAYLDLYRQLLAWRGEA